MMRQQSPHDYRLLLEAILTELALYAKELCPAADVEASALHYEDEDGRVEVFPPPGLPDAEEERIEQALAERLLHVARLVEVLADVGVVHGRLVGGEVGRAGLEPAVDRLRGEAPGLDGVMDALWGVSLGST